jgi:hypothetical protein
LTVKGKSIGLRSLRDWDSIPSGLATIVAGAASSGKWVTGVAIERLDCVMDLSSIRVFVTDGFWRKTLAAVRALGRAGVRITVGESTYLATAFFSRYCHARVRTPSPVLQPQDYLDFLEEYLSRHRHDVLLPMEEATLLLLARYHDRFERLTRLPISDYQTLELARDKLQVLQRADALSIPIPQTYPVPDLETGQILLDTLPIRWWSNHDWVPAAPELNM